MKKNHLFAKSVGAILFALFIVSCDNPNSDSASGSKPEAVLPDKVIWEPTTTAEEQFITVSDSAWENDGTLKSDFTGVAPLIQFDKEIDLTGYKYLNIEAYCPDDGYHVIGFTGFSKSPREKVARLQAFSSKEAQIFQTDFGVNNKEWPDYSSGEFQVKESTSNKISEILIFALNPFDGNLPDISDVHICVKKIVATNKKITNDPSKDKVIFKSIEEDGHKFTTQTEEEDWKSNFIYFGDLDLDGYKYINLEISSPNNENYSVNVESWNNSFKTDVESARKLEFSRILTDEMKVYQAPFGVFKKYWFDWRESENYKKTITDNVITYLYISTQDTENDWSWAPGVDVYVKSITATNNKIDNTDTTKDKVVYSPIESEGRKITTKNGWTYLDTGCIDLNGYNYLNIELASPNSGNDVVTMKARDYCNDINGSLVALLTNDFSTFQIPYKGNELRSFAIWVSDSENNLNCVSDVDIYIKKIWATNTKQVKDTSKDKLLFEASNQKGVKFTTKKNDSIWFNMYDQDLTGYEYLNVEFYSPDVENKVIYLDGWTDGESVVELGAYLGGTSETKTRTMQSKINHNRIGGFSVYACAIDSKDWSQEGIDVYIKKVYATNTKLESDNPKEKTVFSSTEENGFISESTSEGNGYRNIYLGMNDLTGYKYLNIELGIPNRTKDCKFVIDAWGEKERVATYDSLMLGDTMVIQSVFGTNNGIWNDWIDGEHVTKPSTSNILRLICVSIEELGVDGKIGDVQFCIKRIWATNTEM